MSKTYMLCLFCKKYDLPLILRFIPYHYDLFSDEMYIYSTDNDFNLITVNVNAPFEKVPNALVIHRKGETNTLFTINAMNQVLRKINNNVLDTSIEFPWESYQNSLIYTTSQEFKKVNIEFFKKISKKDIKTFGF